MSNPGPNPSPTPQQIEFVLNLAISSTTFINNQLTQINNNFMPVPTPIKPTINAQLQALIGQVNQTGALLQQILVKNGGGNLP
jgi:hypothetical protein